MDKTLGRYWQLRWGVLLLAISIPMLFEVAQSLTFAQRMAMFASCLLYGEWGYLWAKA